MFKELTLLPRQYLFRSTNNLSDCKPRVPSKNELPNEVRYHIFQLQDKLKRIKNDKIIKTQIKSCNKKFDIALNQYLETCAYFDELCLHHPAYEAIVEETNSNYQDVHFQDLETRYACRTAEIRILKSKYAQKLTLMRMTYVSFMCLPFIQCIEKIIPYLSRRYFCYTGYKIINNQEFTLFALQQIMTWLAIHFLENENMKTMIDQFVSNIECYIDEIAMKRKELYLMMGGSEFTNRMTRNYLSAMEVLYNRREAFQFLLIKKRLSCIKSSVHTSVIIPRQSAETSFFGNDDLIRIVISYIIGNQSLYCPVHIMFTFP